MTTSASKASVIKSSNWIVITEAVGSKIIIIKELRHTSGQPCDTYITQLYRAANASSVFDEAFQSYVSTTHGNTAAQLLGGGDISEVTENRGNFQTK